MGVRHVVCKAVVVLLTPGWLPGVGSRWPSGVLAPSVGVARNAFAIQSAKVCSSYVRVSLKRYVSGWRRVAVRWGGCLEKLNTYCCQLLGVGAGRRGTVALLGLFCQRHYLLRKPLHELLRCGVVVRQAALLGSTGAGLRPRPRRRAQCGRQPTDATRTNGMMSGQATSAMRPRCQPLAQAPMPAA